MAVGRRFLFFLLPWTSLWAQPMICADSATEQITKRCVALNPRDVEIPDASAMGMAGYAAKSLASWVPGLASRVRSDREYAAVFAEVEEQFRSYWTRFAATPPEGKSCDVQGREGVQVVGKQLSRVPCPQAGTFSYSRSFSIAKGRDCRQQAMAQAQAWTQEVLGGRNTSGKDLWQKCSDPRCSFSPTRLIQFKEGAEDCSIQEELNVECTAQRVGSEGWVVPFVLLEWTCEEQAPSPGALRF